MGRLNNSSGSILAVVVPGIFFLIGLGSITFGIYNVHRSLESRFWPATDGRIVSSTVEEEVSRDSDGNYSTSYHARVDYRYYTGEREYRSDRVSFGEYGGPASHARETVNRYPAGRAVTVFYDGDDPSSAVLETGISFGNAVPFIFGTFFMSFPVALWGLMIRSRRKKAATGGRRV